MAEKERFLTRWSRLKRVRTAQATAVPPDPPQLAGQELPPLDELDFGSDFSVFLRQGVEESLKRPALKKLFHSEHFQQMDGLDVYIEDYGRCEPIPAAMLRRLEQARGLLFPATGETETTASSPAADAADAHHTAARIPSDSPGQADGMEQA